MNSGMHVPRDRPLDELTTELVQMLGHPDPRWRDDTAYPLLASWIRDGEYDDLLVGLGDGIARGLINGLGYDADDSVLRRSFSALILAEIVNRDNNALLLSSRPIMRWGDEATSWYVREQDLRGWIPNHGWAHAIAHGADLLGAFARSRHLARKIGRASCRERGRRPLGPAGVTRRRARGAGRSVHARTGGTPGRG